MYSFDLWSLAERKESWPPHLLYHVIESQENNLSSSIANDMKFNSFLLNNQIQFCTFWQKDKFSLFCQNKHDITHNLYIMANPLPPLCHIWWHCPILPPKECHIFFEWPLRLSSKSYSPSLLLHLSAKKRRFVRLCFMVTNIYNLMYLGAIWKMLPFSTFVMKIWQSPDFFPCDIFDSSRLS